MDIDVISGDAMKFVTVSSLRYLPSVSLKFIIAHRSAMELSCHRYFYPLENSSSSRDAYRIIRGECRRATRLNALSVSPGPLTKTVVDRDCATLGNSCSPM